MVGMSTVRALAISASSLCLRLNEDILDDTKKIVWFLSSQAFIAAFIPLGFAPGRGRFPDVKKGQVWVRVQGRVYG